MKHVPCMVYVKSSAIIGVLVALAQPALAQEPVADPNAPPATAPAAVEPAAGEASAAVMVDASSDATAGSGAAELTTAPVEHREAPAAEGFAKAFHVGLGVRTQYVYDPDPKTHNVGFDVRPYLSGQIHQYVKVTGNLDVGGGTGGVPETVQVLDGILQLEFNDYANFWLGRLLPPNDRANLSGPYYQNSWNYPVLTSGYPGVYAGRDDGAAYWGQAGGGAFKWQLGVFGLEGGATQPRYYGRVVVNFLDPEPGYYNSSTYYGTKDVLGLGAVVNHDRNFDGASGNGTRFSLDALYSGRSGLDLEGAYYNFESVDGGTGFSFLAAYLIPGQAGFGQIQPQARFQSFSNDVPGDVSQQATDIALNYIIDGHNARLTLTYQKLTGDTEADSILFGGQVQL